LLTILVKTKRYRLSRTLLTNYLQSYNVKPIYPGLHWLPIFAVFRAIIYCNDGRGHHSLPRKCIY
jgi:hypothetical protein